MLPVLMKQGTKVGEQLLGGRGGKSALSQARDQFLLTNDMPLALGDVILDHLEVGRGVSHGR